MPDHGLLRHYLSLFQHVLVEALNLHVDSLVWEFRGQLLFIL